MESMALLKDKNYSPSLLVEYTYFDLLSGNIRRCDPPWLFENTTKTCIRAYSTGKTFVDAQKTCSGLGGNLVDIKTHDIRNTSELAMKAAGETRLQYFFKSF